MYLLIGNSHMESGDYKSAIQLFEHARAQMRPYSTQVLSMISLASLLVGIPQCVKTVTIPFFFLHFGLLARIMLTLSSSLTLNYLFLLHLRSLSSDVLRYLPLCISTFFLHLLKRSRSFRMISHISFLVPLLCFLFRLGPCTIVPTI